MQSGSSSEAWENGGMSHLHVPSPRHDENCRVKLGLYQAMSSIPDTRVVCNITRKTDGGGKHRG